MKVKVKVPATSANMGPGFDSIGVAVQLYNHLEVETIEKGFEIVVKKEQSIAIPTDEKNLIYQTMQQFFEKLGKPMPAVRLTQSDDIPMARGLGSSAACIVGGLLAANALAGNPCTKDELAQMAAQIEGHPDNSNPAFFGSMVTGVMTEKSMEYVRLELPEDLLFAIIVPNFPVSTKSSRSVLPPHYDRQDVVYNVSRAALLVASVLTGKYENLEVAMDDKIHQPYRKVLIPHMEEIFENAKKCGAIACYLSGAGSTLMAMVTKEHAEKFRNNMSTYLQTLPDGWQLTLLSADKEGATVVTE